MWVDSHAHVFLNDSPEYPWDAQAPIRPSYSAPVAVLLQEMQRTQVDKAVLVQHSCYGYDNRYILDCVKHHSDRFCAIVKVDPVGDESLSQLEQLVRDRRVRGLRLQPVSQPGSSWLADKKTFPLWEICASYGLIVGILLEPHQLPMAETVIRAFPTVKVIIDHMGRLNVEAPPDSEAFQRLLNLSALDNVFIKLSGFYALSQRQYPYEDLILKVFALFRAYGAPRLMWASDFPLLIHAGESYGQATEILNHQLPKLTVTQREWIMGRTAANLFGW